MKNTSLNKKINLSLLIFGVLLSVIYAVCTATVYESDVQYFAYKALLPKIFYIGSALLVLLAVVNGFMTKKSLKLPEFHSNIYGKSASLLCAILICAYKALDLVNVLASDKYYSDMRYVFTEPTFMQKLTYDRQNILCLASLVFALICALYFLLDGIDRGSKPTRILLEYGIVGFYGSTLLMWYFDTSHPINGDLYIVDQLGAVCFMLFILCELREKLDKSVPRFYCLFGVCAPTFLASSGLGYIFGFLFGKTENSPMLIIFGIFELAQAIYVIVRALQKLSAKEEIVPEPVVFEKENEDSEEIKITNETEAE